MLPFVFTNSKVIYVKKITILNTLVTMTMTSHVENSKTSLSYMFTCEFPVSYITLSVDHDK